jgi:outer membrane protein OmpA-like peptidoglycan-associated protein
MLAAVMLLAACASIYETGSDMSAEWVLTPVSAANGPFDDLAPAATAEGLYFTSNREVDEEENDRMYFLPHGAARPEFLRLHGDAVRSGALLLRGPETKVLFTQCYRDDAVGDCDLVEGRIGDDPTVIRDIRLLPEGLNDVEWDHHPAMAGDGGPGSVLVFASERFGGEGGSDLWMSLRTADGWDTPINLGPLVNTDGNEISPWLTPDGRELYFSSDAHPGRGGFDVYRAQLPEGSTPASGAWRGPEPLGAPVNSNEDDIFFTGPLAADTVYFASNREGGMGGYDLYLCARKTSIETTPPPPPPPVEKEKPLVLRVRAVNAYTMEAVDAVISVTPAESDLMLAEGTTVVELPLTVDGRYSITAMRAGYMNAMEEYYAGGDATVTRKARDEGDRMVIEHAVILMPTAEEERKIYSFTVEFDFNLSNIRPEEEKKLDSAAVLLGKFPQSTVVVSGHTDSVGTVSYNIKLGYRRATEVSEYVETWLRRRDVRLVNDMEIRTYGESQPVAPNRTEQGRQRNRRVEIAIVRNR